jgi:hypothetical protein
MATSMIHIKKEITASYEYEYEYEYEDEDEDEEAA